MSKVESILMIALLISAPFVAHLAASDRKCETKCSTRCMTWGEDGSCKAQEITCVTTCSD